MNLSIILSATKSVDNVTLIRYANEMRKALYIVIGAPVSLGLSVLVWTVNPVVGVLTFFFVAGCFVSFYEGEDGADNGNEDLRYL